MATMGASSQDIVTFLRVELTPRDFDIPQKSVLSRKRRVF